MMVLRFYAGPIVHRFSPLGLLAFSAAVAAVGLGALSISSGLLILGAATLYGFGKTFFWPTMLGVVAEQFPRGGALTLNSIAAVGMLSVGVIGNPLFGVIQDHQIEQRLAEKEGLHENLVSENTGIFGKYQAIDPEKMKSFENKLEDLKAKKSKLTEKIESTEDESKKQNLIAEKKTLTKEKIEPLATNIALVQTTREEVKKNTLLWVAILPVIMLICYLLLIVYFRAKGGYQAEVLTGDAAEDEKFVGGVEGAMEA